MKETLEYIKEIYLRTQKITVFEKTLDRNKDDRVRRAKQLSDILKKYDDILELKERKETIDSALAYGKS